MMEFFLSFKIHPLSIPISYGDKVMLIGSCFSKEIGDKLAALKFDIFQNPTGILYHPLNIADTIIRCISREEFTENDLHERNGLFHSWQHHSEFSSLNKEQALININSKLIDAHEFISSTNYLIITPATAFAYSLIENNVLVSNCHKASSSLFEKKLINPELIALKLSESISALRKLNPGIKILFTISPVKHLKDGVINNNRSKAVVIQAIQTICNNTPDSYYFPSFEIMNDELRDYRFYKNDFAHPNETAINYIFERFIDTCISGQSRSLIPAVKEILDGVHHRALFPGSDQHRKFIDSLLRKMGSLEKQYSFLDFRKEREILKNRIPDQSNN